MNTNGTTTSAPATALVRHETQGALEPATLTELRALAKDAADSGFFGAKTPQQAVMIMMTGRDLGLSYSQALRAFHVIEVSGRPPKPTLSADGMVAVCMSHRDVCEYFRIVESDDTKATVEAKRVGDPPRRVTFTVEEAKRAGLIKDGGNWQKWPGRMCLARAKSFLARDLFADLLLGLYETDEMREVLEERHERPAPRPPASAPVVAEAEVVPDATIDEAARLEALIRMAGTLDERDAAVKEIVKSHKAKRITPQQLEVLQRYAIEKKTELGGQ